MAKNGGKSGQTASKAPDSTNILELYKNYVELIEEVTKEVVTSSLLKPVTVSKIKKYNKVLVDVISGMVDSLDSISRKIAKFTYLTNEKTVIKLINAYTRLLLAVEKNISLIDNIASLSNPFKLIKLIIGLKVFGKFAKKLVSTMQSIMVWTFNGGSDDEGNPLKVQINPMELLKAAGVIELIVVVFMSLAACIDKLSKMVFKTQVSFITLWLIKSFIRKLIRLVEWIILKVRPEELWMVTISLFMLIIVLNMMSYTMKKCVIMLILGIPAILSLILIGWFFILLTALMAAIASLKIITIPTLESLLLLGKVTLLLALVIFSFVILGMIVLKYWKSTLLGFALLFITVIAIYAFFHFMANKNVTIKVMKGSGNVWNMVLAMMGLMTGLLFVSKVTKKLNEDDFKRIFVIVGITLAVFFAMSRFGGEIQKGGIGMVLVAASMLLFAVSLRTVNETVKGISGMDFVNMFNTVGVILLIYGLLGTPEAFVFITMGGIVMTLVGTSLLLFGTGLMLIKNAITGLSVENFKVLKDVVEMICWTYGIIGIPPVAVFVALGSAVMTTIGASLLVFALGLLAIGKVAKVINTKAIERMLKNFEKIIESIGNTIINPIKYAKALINISLIRSVSGGIASIASDIARIAKLQIPCEWNDKGKAVKYETLKFGDITNAQSNITTLMTALLDDKVLNKMETTAKNYDYYETGIVAAFFSAIGNISNIANTIIKFATLMVPDEWNKDGVPIHYAKMNPEYITQARKNVVNIITSLLTALSNKDLADNINSLNEESSERIKTIFESIGNISSVAETVLKMASLQVPDEWNKDGVPIHYVKVNPNDITDAQTNVMTIMKSLIDAIAYPSTKMELARLSKDTMELLGTVFDSAGKIGAMVDLVVKLAAGSFPVEIDERSGRVKKYGSFTSMMGEDGAKKISDNISNIITCLTDGIINAVNGREEDIKNVSMSVSALSVTVSPLSSLVDTVIKMNTNTAFKNFNGETFKTNVKTLFEAIINPFTDSKIIPDNAPELIRAKVSSVERVAAVMKELSEVDSKKFNGNISKTVDATNKFLTQLNSVDTNKLNVMDRISSNMMEFAKSIDGNFDALAEALSEKLVTVLEELKETLDGVGQSLEDSSDKFASSATAPTTVAAETAPANVKSEKAMAEDKNSKQNQSMIINKLDDIYKQLKNYPLNVNVKNDTLSVEVKK